MTTESEPQDSNQPSPDQTNTDPMVRISGGEFTMGSDHHYPDEGPSQRVQVDDFMIGRAPITNAEYAKFVDEVGYVTLAEIAPDADAYPGAPPELLVPGSSVFHMSDGPVDLHDWTLWWRWTPGADWRHPNGPESDLSGLDNHPVVHVAHEDAIAYCEWRGVRLPTEAEWELAARGGLDGAEFAWGQDDPQETDPLANTWQGQFPYENTELDDWINTSPVASYPPNQFGLSDMIGNVWEWTEDWYSPRGAVPGTPDQTPAPSCCVPSNPLGGTREASVDPLIPDIPIPRKVLKGGSFLCSVQYCFRYRPAARQAQMIDTALSNQGFRCAAES